MDLYYTPNKADSNDFFYLHRVFKSRAEREIIILH